MLTATHSALQAPDLQNCFKADTDTHAHRTSQIKANSRATVDLTIVTAEGDTVSLSATSVLRAAYTTYDAQGRLHGGSGLTAETSRLSAKNQVALEVEGNLNAEELADVEQLLGHLTEMATDFFAGDVDSAIESALENDDLDTIAAFEASLTLHQQVSVRQRLGASQTDGNMFARVPEMPWQGRPETASGVLLSDAANTPSASRSGVSQVIDNLMQAARDSNLSAETLSEHLPGFVSELLDHLADDLNLDTTARKLAAHMSSTFTQRLRHAVAEGDDETARFIQPIETSPLQAASETANA